MTRSVMGFDRGFGKNNLGNKSIYGKSIYGNLNRPKISFLDLDKRKPNF